MKKIAIFLIFCFHADSFGQEVEGDIELAGFVLGQHKETVYAQLGPPIQRSKTTDGWVYEFHNLKPDTSVYALFKYSPRDTTRIYAIQVTGRHYDEMHPFRGLKLGAKKEHVHTALGDPHKSEAVEDPPLVTQYYLHKNYSVDIDSKGHLYGIQIFGNILDRKPKGDPSIRHFKNAVLTRNIDSLLLWMSPDIEIHRNGKVITYTVGARAELNNKQGELHKYLLGETESVWAAFGKEYASGTSESRLHPELNQMTIVDKFFDSSILSEVVFRMHAGKWKVYEIKFR